MSDLKNIDDRLHRLGSATRSLRASPGFVERVMANVGRVEVVWWQVLSGPTRWVLPMAVVLALVTVGWAYQARNALDESLAIGFGAESYSIVEGVP